MCWFKSSVSCNLKKKKKRTLLFNVFFFFLLNYFSFDRTCIRSITFHGKTMAYTDFIIYIQIHVRESKRRGILKAIERGENKKKKKSLPAALRKKVVAMKATRIARRIISVRININKFDDKHG